jgi:hypothetical protein
MSLVLTNVSQEKLRISGGTIIGVAPSVFSPLGHLFVVCNKHPEKKIPISLGFDDNDTMLDTIHKVLESCSECCEEREQRMLWKSTRWPEGAEI